MHPLLGSQGSPSGCNTGIRQACLERRWRLGITLPSPPTFSFSKLPTGGDSRESGGRCDSGTVCVWGCIHVTLYVCGVLLKHACSRKIGNRYSQLANPSSAPAQPVWMATSSAGLGWPLQPSFTGFCAHICVTLSNIYSCTSQTCTPIGLLAPKCLDRGVACVYLHQTRFPDPSPPPTPSFRCADWLPKLKFL